jgi:hypothetical protein
MHPNELLLATSLLALDTKYPFGLRAKGNRKHKPRTKNPNLRPFYFLNGTLVDLKQVKDKDLKYVVSVEADCKKNAIKKIKLCTY